MFLSAGFSFASLILLLCVAPAHYLEGNNASPSSSSLKAPITYLEAKRLALQVLSPNVSIKKVRSFGGEAWNKQGFHATSMNYKDAR